MFKRWTRCANASATSLPTLINVEIRGIPAHAWSRSTTDFLLRDSCIISELHPATALKTDLSSFMLKAWCLDPRNLHRDMTLIISEPGPAAGEKRCLPYKISLMVTPVDASEKAIVIPTPLSDSDPPDGDGDSFFPGSPQRRSMHSAGGRRSVHSRLGPQLPSRRMEGGQREAGEPSLKMHSSVESALGTASDPCMHMNCLLGGSSLELLVGATEQTAGLVSKETIMLDSLRDGRLEETHSEDGQLEQDSLRDGRLEETHSEDGQLEQVALLSPQQSAGPLKSNGPLQQDEGTLGPVTHSDVGPLGQVTLISPQHSVGPLETDRPVSPQRQSCRMHPNVYGTSLKVYSRRRQRDSVGQVDAPEDESPSKQQFFEMVSKKIGCLLPTPKAKKMRKPAIPSQGLRRSRRVAGLGAEHIPQIPRAKILVMKTIHNTSDKNQLNSEDLETYAKLFCHPLSYPQVQALAALFGWAVPDDLGGAATMVC